MFELSERWSRREPASSEALAQLWRRWGDVIPGDYLEFLRSTNGAAGENFEFWPVNEVLSDPYQAAEFGPHLTVIETDHCGELFALDTRVRPAATSMVHAVSNWDEDVAVVAHNFRHLTERMAKQLDEPGAILLDPF